MSGLAVELCAETAEVLSFCIQIHEGYYDRQQATRYGSHLVYSHKEIVAATVVKFQTRTVSDVEAAKDYQHQ